MASGSLAGCGNAARLGRLTVLLELGLDDGRLPDGHGLGRGNGVPGGVLRGRGGRFERRRQIARPLFRHLIVARVKELLLRNK